MTTARVAGFAQLMSDRTERMVFAAAAIVTLTGVYLLWNSPQQRMSIEEHVKDGDLSEEVGERRRRAYLWVAALMIVVGLGLVILVTVT